VGNAPPQLIIISFHLALPLYRSLSRNDFPLPETALDFLPPTLHTLLPPAPSLRLYKQHPFIALDINLYEFILSFERSIAVGCLVMHH